MLITELVFLLLSQAAQPQLAPSTQPPQETAPAVTLCTNFREWAKNNGMSYVKVPEACPENSEVEITEGIDSLLQWCITDKQSWFIDTEFVGRAHKGMLLLSRYGANRGLIGCRYRPHKKDDPIFHATFRPMSDGSYSALLHFDEEGGVGHFWRVLHHGSFKKMTSEEYIHEKIILGLTEPERIVTFTSFKSRFAEYSKENLLMRPIARSFLISGFHQLTSSDKGWQSPVYPNRLLNSYVHGVEFNGIKLLSESLLFQDYSYRRKGKGKILARVWYSLSSPLLARNTLTGNSDFSYGEIGAAFFTPMMWHPGDPRPGRMSKEALFNLGSDSISNLGKEFWPDIKKVFHR